jgi:hypothetical protein
MARSDAKEVSAVLSAYVLIQTEVGKVAHVAQALSALDGGPLAEDLAGPYDASPGCRRPVWISWAGWWPGHIQVVDGVTRTPDLHVLHR